MVELFTINVVIVLGDIALVVLEYLGETLTERTWKGLVYSIVPPPSSIIGFADLFQRYQTETRVCHPQQIGRPCASPPE